MKTPIVDFIARYTEKNPRRFHMPGHKGKPFLGFESMDITEIPGADALYEAQGIIAESEENARGLFDTRSTFYSTEGSSQCIRAMLYMAVTRAGCGSKTVVAARNVHKAFVTAAALLDIDVVWLWPEETSSLCGCKVIPEDLESTLSSLENPPAAVYITSPDYLGGTADIPALVEVCRRHGTILAVDNAHGAYLHFLEKPVHPMDLGADICCDSAHKTLPALTGGAYLHIGRSAPEKMEDSAKTALSLFGSTSPSYLILASLDRCNRYLADGYRDRLCRTVSYIDEFKGLLIKAGWEVQQSDPLRITIAAPYGCRGDDLARRLREQGTECEYADGDFLVLMATPENSGEDFAALLNALGKNTAGAGKRVSLPLARGERVCSIRQAMFAPRETVPGEEALGRICGATTVGCPPAVPIAVSGERIGEEALALFRRYGVKNIDVLQ